MKNIKIIFNFFLKIIFIYQNKFYICLGNKAKINHEKKKNENMKNLVKTFLSKAKHQHTFALIAALYILWQLAFKS